MATRWTGLEEFTDLIKRIEDMPSNLGKEMQDRLQQLTPKRTGRLANAWEQDVDGYNVTLRNDLPYAAVVEYGDADQAPAGMARTTLNEVPAMVKKHLGD